VRAFVSGHTDLIGDKFQEVGIWEVKSCYGTCVEFRVKGGRSAQMTQSASKHDGDLRGLVLICTCAVLVLKPYDATEEIIGLTRCPGY
jgi:hypothetical protein